MSEQKSLGVIMKCRIPCGHGLAAGIGLALLVVATMRPAFVRADQAVAPPANGSSKAVSPANNAEPVRQCLSDLKTADVQFRDLGVVTKDDCTVQAAVELDAVSSPFGKVSLTGKPTMSCLFARRFTNWVRDVAAPLTLSYMGSKLSVIETAGSFVCRTRDNRRGEKLSEHAKGNAVDVATFRLENRQIVSVGSAVASAKIDGVLLRALRTTACGYFTTVLGPGSDEAHSEHLHFDYGLHGPTDNYRICE
jgi:hypothetical protein